eukprot:SAG22_NODE_2679_length_2314_cov_1.732280_2_plen_107_part_00
MRSAQAAAAAAAAVVACALISSGAALPQGHHQLASESNASGGPSDHDESLQDMMQNACGDSGGGLGDVYDKMFPPGLKLADACLASVQEIGAMNGAGYSLVRSILK